jgi:hypothetical protein
VDGARDGFAELEFRVEAIGEELAAVRAELTRLRGEQERARTRPTPATGVAPSTSPAVQDRGVCPICGHPLGRVTAGEGYCDEHGWQRAEQRRPAMPAAAGEPRRIVRKAAQPTRPTEPPPPPTWEPPAPPSKPAPAEPRAPVQAPVAAQVGPAAPERPAAPPLPPRPPKPPRPTTREWLERYDLLGARGLALAGGTVMLLGVVFLFVLAVNRGWVGPSARVAIGAMVSLLLIGAGLVLERRYGLLDAAVAAVATGIAGGYATLAAATILYDMAPTWAALLVATAIAAGASVIAVAWKAELIGILGLLGALSAPALVAVDEGLTAPGTAFALLVFAGAASAAVWMRWRWLLALAAVDVTMQLLVLAGATEPGDTFAVVVEYTAAVALVGSAVAWHVVLRRPQVDWLTGGLVATATVVTAATIRLFESEMWAGTATLVAAIVATSAATALARRLAALGEAVGIASIVLVVAGVGAWWSAGVSGGSASAVVVTQVTAVVLLAGAVEWQRGCAPRSLDPFPLVFVVTGAAFLVASSPALYDLDVTRGVALVLAAIVATAASTVLARRQAPLGEAVGLAAIAVAAAGGLYWTVGTVAFGDRTAIVVAAGAALTLLGGAVGWQFARPPGALHPMAATFVTASLALALTSSRALLDVDRDRGIALLVAALVVAGVAVGVARRAVDLTRVLGATALVLVAVATADLVSGRNLAIAWSAQAVGLAVVAYVARNVRFELAALAYLGLALSHVVLTDVAGGPTGTEAILGGAAPSLFASAAAALAIGLLAPRARADSPSSGLLAAFEPVWDGLLDVRVGLRASLACSAFALAALATDGVASDRALTVAWAAQAALLAGAARFAREIRLQPFALASLLLAGVHALTVEAPPTSLFEPEGYDVLAAVPSVAALLVATGVACATAVVRGPGIAWLGPPAGPELVLLRLQRVQRELRNWLLVTAMTLALFAAGLLLVGWDYSAGQVAATVTWGAVSLVAITVWARAGMIPQLAAGWALLAFAIAKGVAFDSVDLSRTAGGWSLLLLAPSLVLAGLATRWFVTPTRDPLEAFSAIAAGTSLALAWWGLDRLTTTDRTLGLTLVAVAAGYGALAAVPYMSWRRGEEPTRPWLRRLTTAYWSIGLVSLLAGEALFVDRRAGVAAAYAVTSAGLAVVALPLREKLLALAGLALLGLTTVAALAVVTPPSRFLEASEHPGRSLWALAVITAAWLVMILTDAAAPLLPSRWLLLVLGVLSLYLLSLGILEFVQLVSGGTVNTGFQRGHTAVSVAWAVIALTLFGVGLARAPASVRWAGLSLFGVALAKLFVYDLRTLSSMTRALSFLLVGALLLAAAFFAQRLTRSNGGSWSHGPPGSPTA